MALRPRDSATRYSATRDSATRHSVPRREERGGRHAVGVQSTMFDRVGGEEFFEGLTRRFYAGVAADAVLSRLYPTGPDDLEASRRHLQAFLVQYWGGPATYSEERGHPKLRLRHAPFVIGPAERDAWLAHMTEAVRQAGLRPLDETQMLTYFQASAAHMVNVAE